ncbi:DUF6143 family protein [Niameybacter massiliensis]|uniref:DUF6143 family protein n=1 Tax=Holtiella tumoricola TaxID=3018743 RepID=A0AA42J087_9FIRM|nr:DUF6143 family protein [Holtiella tumoricola]MDA3731089.1 DUF6143 family protein [Holtiella tumoricola]
MFNCLPPETASMPNSLFHALQGQYFVGYADNISLNNGNNAWASLSNPIGSGVNLFVNVWTVTEPSTTPLNIQVWLNATLPVPLTPSTFVTPTNTAFFPLPTPEVQIFKASNTNATPTGGAIAYTRLSVPGQTLADEEDGKFIIPPGGNFALFFSNPSTTTNTTNIKVAFGWWEEPICRY